MVLVAPEGVRITIGSLLTSRWGWRALAWKPDAVVVQWGNPMGRGHEAADRAAMVLQPRGFHVVMEDGRRMWVPARQRLLRPLRVAARWMVGMVRVVIASRPGYAAITERLTSAGLRESREFVSLGELPAATT